MQPSSPKQSNVKLITTVVAIIVIAGAIVLVDHFRSAQSSSTKQTATVQSTHAVAGSTTATNSATGSTDTASSTGTYTDGTYTASSDYYVPHGSEEISVTLTLKDGVVTDSSITNSEGDHDSARYQEEFASSYKQYVIGKKISGLQISAVSGASDTTEGFNDALSQIASKAKA